MIAPSVKAIVLLSGMLVLVDTVAPDFNGIAAQASKLGLEGLLIMAVVSLWKTLKEERNENKKLYETLVSDRLESKALTAKMCDTLDEMKDLLSNHLVTVRSVLGSHKDQQ